MKKIYKFTDSHYRNWQGSIWEFLEKRTSYLCRFRLIHYEPSLLNDASIESIEEWKKSFASLNLEQVTQVCPACWNDECPGFVKNEIL